MNCQSAYIYRVLTEVASCRHGNHLGTNIEWIIAAVLTIEQFGPAGLNQEQIVRIVLDVLNGRRSVQQSILALFREGPYPEH
jgi:hypothetical protein